MSYEVKLGYIPGQNLVFTAYQPNGSGRGIAYQPLIELAYGYYSGSPSTTLIAGDEIIAYTIENVLWEGSQVYVITYDSIYWQGDRVSYEDDWVYNLDSTVTEAVTSIGSVVAANEYMISIEDFNEVLEDIDNIETSVDALVLGQSKYVGTGISLRTGSGAVVYGGSVVPFAKPEDD